MHFLIACLVSAAIVLGSPFMGQLQSFLRRSLSTRNYVLLFGVGVLAGVGLAILIALVRIRERRAQRFALLVIALLIGGSYMWWTATPYAEVNAVERVHFVEYGLIAFLFYRAGLPRRPVRRRLGEGGSPGEGGRHGGDASIVVLPVLAAFAVGILDEWLQWFIPFRVGEAHDVFLNLAAIVCGLLFSLALLPPASWASRLRADSWRRIGVAAAIVWLIFAAFISQVHLGHLIEVAGIGRFKSHFTEAELDELQRHRAALWQTQPPVRVQRLSREDQYLDEGLAHVRRRNTAGFDEAWRENLILERFFVPVLDFPTYASPGGNRWPPEQRADIANRATPIDSFLSTAELYPILAWSHTAFWFGASAIALVVLLVPLTLARPQRG